MSRIALTAASLGLALLLSPSPARADITFAMDFQADGNSRWYEFFSNGFAQIDRGHGGNQALDGMYDIDANPDQLNPTVYNELVFAADVFPNESDFSNSYSVTYADAALTGIGAEIATVTGLSLNFNADVADNDALGQLPYASVVSGLSGTVSLLNGVVTAINLASDISFQFNTALIGQPFGIITFDGDFSIAGNRFDLFVDDSVTLPVPDPIPFRYVWDVQGNIANVTPAAVPEPSSLLLLGTLGAATGAASWRKRRKAAA